MVHAKRYSQQTDFGRTCDLGYIQVVFEFYYNDADLFCCHIKTDDLQCDMGENGLLSQ